MVVGFLVTAYLALFLLLVQYVLDFDPTLNPFRRPGQPMRLLRPNPIDMLIHRCKLWFCVRVLRIKKFSTRNDRLQPTGGMTHESDDGDSISKVHYLHHLICVRLI